MPDIKTRDDLIDRYARLVDDQQEQIESLTSQVSVLTKERDANLTAFDRAVEDGRRVEKRLVEELQGVRVRMVAAESRLSAVSEVVSALKTAIIPLAALVVSGECVAAQTALSEELKVAIVEAHDASLTALTNYEKAQQKEGQ